MNRRLLLFAAFVFLAVTSVTMAATAPARMNMLLILTDQQSADVMSCAQGNRYLRTPNMDRLAGQGVRFTRAYVANPICVPSRTALFTGCYPHQTGVQDNDQHPVDPKKFPSLGRQFHQAGYATGYVGKWHIPFAISEPDAGGFDYTANLKTNGSDKGTPPAVAEFLARKREQPFFLVASFVNPHNICEWARGQKLPDGDVGPPPPPEECPPAPANLAAPIDEPDAITLTRRAYHANPQFPVGDFDAARWRQYRWAYYRMVEKVDAGIGRVLDSLEASGQADNTLIILTTDHGDCQGAHGWNQKTAFNDESTRVPFIVCPPGRKSAGTSDMLVQTGIDLFPTLCDYAAIPAPPGLPGMSVRATVEGRPGSGKTRSFIVVSNHFVQGMPILGVKPTPAGRMLRTERYKYCVYDQGERRESLVDMTQDPGEQRNLANDAAFAPVLVEHRRQIAEWSRTTGDLAFPYVRGK
jgi:arylsulfatase A-like enzyme